MKRQTITTIILALLVAVAGVYAGLSLYSALNPDYSALQVGAERIRQEFNPSELENVEEYIVEEPES